MYTQTLHDTFTFSRKLCFFSFECIWNIQRHKILKISIKSSHINFLMIFVQFVLFKNINVHINTGAIYCYVLKTCNSTLLHFIWLDRKHCRWTLATATLYINIYLHREYRKTSFICCLIVTTKNLILPVVFLFSVHGDQQRNNIYLQCCKKTSYSLKRQIQYWLQFCNISFLKTKNC